MKKIPTVFKRIFDGYKIIDILPEITEGCETAFLCGDATVKFDGSPIAIIKKYPSARYYYLLGGRGTGKTFQTVKKCIIDFLEGRGVSAYVRRYKESLTIRNMSDLMSPHNAWLAEYTKGKWNRITYYQRGAYLERWETDEEGAEERVERCKTPVIGFWAMNTWETDKGGDFGFDWGTRK